MDSLKKWALALGIILLAYALLPTLYVIDFETPKGMELNGTVSVSGLLSFSSSGERVFLLLPRGTYTLTYDSENRQPKNESLPIWEFIPFVHKKTVLEPALFSFADMKFYEPYGLVELEPEIVVKGVTIDGDMFEKSGNRQTLFPYGEYYINFRTEFFELDNFTFPEDNTNMVKLVPNNNTVVLDEREAGWVATFMGDYLELSAQGLLSDGGFPRQFYVYSKNATLSLGDMLFVVCQLGKNGSVWYAPKNMNYRVEGDEDCYSSLLSGKMPENINGMRSEQAVYGQLSPVVRTIEFSFGELNQKKHQLDWGLSYDIEYGRYVPREAVNSATHSTCTIAPEYLDEKQCLDPDFAGWYSDTTGTFWDGEYGYPVSSGMIGWRYILELGSQYGIPTTQYMVTKDIELFRKKDPLLFDLSHELVDDGLIEIGSHTRYHTRLDKVSEQEARDELLYSKQELENLYNITVQGIRTPYLSLVNDNIPDTERALMDAEYQYYSLYGEHRITTQDNNTLEHKPLNFYGYFGYANQETLNAALANLPYIISLDHPWNILYKEVGDKIIQLEENPKQPVLNKALILEALSRGVHFTTVRGIEIK